MPPLSPQQVKTTARIVMEVVQQQDQDAIDTERRWRATLDTTVR
jgi:hypothetical protein